MSRFAKIVEEVFNRYGEVTGEEFRLYCTIVFHTFVDTGVCRKNLRQLAQIHEFDYIRTTRRFKRLVKLEWCEKTKQGIRPLIGLNVAKKTTFGNEILPKGQHVSCQKDNIDVVEKATFGDEMLPKGQLTLKEYIEPFKDENFPDKNNNEKTVVVSTSNDEKNLSIFTSEECLRYVQIRIERGEKIETPHRLAKWCRNTGEHDAFIRAYLYPEKIAHQQHIEYSDADYELSAALEILRDVAAMGDDVSGFEKYYSPEVWKRLMGELQNAE